VLADWQGPEARGLAEPLVASPADADMDVGSRAASR